MANEKIEFEVFCSTKEEVMEKLEYHIGAISSLLGIPVTESNKDTPHRVAKMYCNELFKNRNDLNLEDLNSRMKVFSNEGMFNPISVKDIPFCSTCEHHWLPFIGKASVTYIPNEHIIGLSKIPRVVKYFSQRPQLQERLTNDIGDYLVKLLNPKYLKVEITDTTHLCVLCRGAESECNTSTVFEFKE